MQQPWIKLFLSILDWEWHTEPETLSFWIHALALASHPEKKYKSLTIKRGQFTGTLNEWSFRMGLSVREIRTAIERLTKTGEITAESPTKQFTLITICNYERYQSVISTFDKRSTNVRQTFDNQMTNEGQTFDNHSTLKIREENIEEKNIEENNNKQQEAEPQFFHNVEECKAFLLSKGRNCSEQGFKQFYKINQEGTKTTAPYWYKDGVIDSFDNFISKDSNKRYRLSENKGTKSPPSSGAPPGVPLWQSSPHEYWATRIGKLSKSDVDLGNVLAKLELADVDGNKFYYRTKNVISKIERNRFNAAFSSICAEFRPVQLIYKQ